MAVLLALVRVEVEGMAVLLVLVRWKWRVWLCCWSWLGGSGGYGCVAGLG